MRNGVRLRDTQCGLFATGKVLRRFGVPFTHLTNCRLNGQVNYVLEGNLNYTGAVITWLKEDVSLIALDGGPTANKYLMQFQSDIAQVTVSVSDVAELSGFGAACAAGFSCGLYDPETIFANTHRSCFTPEMDNTEREARYNGWQKAVRQALTH